LAQAYKQINATKGPVGVNSLIAANRAIASDDATYGKFLTAIGGITDERNTLASQMITLLNGASFGNKPLHRDDAADLVERARKLTDKVEDLSGQQSFATFRAENRIPPASPAGFGMTKSCLLIGTARASVSCWHGTYRLGIAAPGARLCVPSVWAPFPLPLGEA
jgi:hypothetical protein